MSGVAVAATMLACAVLEVLICLDLRRNWVALRANHRSTSMTIRITLFTLVGICAIVVGPNLFRIDGLHNLGITDGWPLLLHCCAY